MNGVQTWRILLGCGNVYDMIPPCATLLGAVAVAYILSNCIQPRLLSVYFPFHRLITPTQPTPYLLQVNTMPPSTSCVCPVTKSLSLLARNPTIFATSSGSLGRLRAVSSLDIRISVPLVCGGTGKRAWR